MKWCAGVLKAKTLIGCCILLEKALNTKISGIIHLDDALHLVVISLDLKLVCKFCKFLVKEWFVAIQIEEQRLCTSSKITIFVETK